MVALACERVRGAVQRCSRFLSVVVVVLVSAPIVVATGFVPATRRRAVVQRALRAVARTLLRCLGVQCTAIGPTPSGPAIIVANHLSWLDIVAALASWPCTFVAKREIRAWPLIGRCAESLGVVFVDRGRKRDLLRAIPALEAALRRGECVVLFPEGTTTDGRDVLRFRSALLEAAVRANAPVVPLAFGGTVAHDSHVNGPAMCWYGVETLVSNVWRLAGARRCEFTLHAGRPLRYENVAAHHAMPRTGHASGVESGTHVRDASSAKPAARKHITARAERVVRELFVPVHFDISSLRRERTAVDWARVAATPSHAVQRMRLDTFASALLAPLVAFAVAISLGFATTPVHRFPEPRAFSGTRWYNPYDALDTLRGAWRLANFHSHSEAWGGLTNGAQTPAAVAAAYRRANYDVIGVSNYQSSPETRVSGTFPVYEHGWNVRKSHHIVFGPDRVVWLDYPLLQTRDQQQHVLETLTRSASLVAIAHPRVRNAHTPNDLRYLTHYDLLEILNRYSMPADAEWDAALSSGHPVWLLASDDSHNAADQDQVGQNATRIFASSTGTNDIVDALRAGRAYAVHGLRGEMPLSLRDMRMRGDTLTAHIGGHADTIRVLGQNGTVRAQIVGRDANAGVVTAIAHADDGYLRVVAVGDSALLYTNPIIRYNGHELSRAEAVIDWPRTVLWRAAWVLTYTWFAWRLIALRRRGRAARRPMRV